MLPCSDEVKRTISDFPDELLLSIFQLLENEDIVMCIAKVCMRWERLASDPALWRDRFVFSNSNKPIEFTRTMRTATGHIKHLHLGGHEAMEEVVIDAVLSSEVTKLKRLSFLGSCRTNPGKVIEILERFGSDVESLTLCINDELVSFGTDKKTCYALKDSNFRPGILFNLIGGMEHLRHLTLHGGYSTKWYFGELLISLGCNKIETLDLKDFEEISEKFNKKSNFVQTLILKNKDHLKSLKLSIMSASSSEVRRSVYECHKSLKNLSINIKQLSGFQNGLLFLNFLELNGRFVHDVQLESLQDISRDSFHRLKELNLIQFDIIQEDMFFNLTKFLRDPNILRIEGNWLSSENISIVAKNSPCLERICVRSTDTVAVKHLVSIHFPLSNVRYIDFDDIFGMDCNIAKQFERIPFLKYSVIDTGCKCHTNCLSDSEFKSNLVSYAVNPELCTSRVVHLTLSNNLDVEFLHKFTNLYKNDRMFHFEQ